VKGGEEGGEAARLRTARMRLEGLFKLNFSLAKTTFIIIVAVKDKNFWIDEKREGIFA